MARRVTYKELKEVLEELDINPYEFWLVANRVEGWFPDIPERKSIKPTERIVKVILEGEEEKS